MPKAKHANLDRKNRIAQTWKRSHLPKKPPKEPFSRKCIPQKYSISNPVRAIVPYTETPDIVIKTTVKMFESTKRRAHVWAIGKGLGAQSAYGVLIEYALDVIQMTVDNSSSNVLESKFL